MCLNSVAQLLIRFSASDEPNLHIYEFKQRFTGKILFSQKLETAIQALVKYSILQSYSEAFGVILLLIRQRLV